MSKDKIIAIACADVHLQSTAPIWRSAEPDWFEAMARPLREIEQLRRKHNCIVLHGGDVFDRWNSSAELINFAMKNLPGCFFSVAGQHDLPYHNMKDIDKSAFHTLDLSTRLCLLGDDQGVDYMNIYGVSYGEKIPSPDKSKKLNILVAHKYVWLNSANSFSGAPKENQLANLKSDLKGYDVAIFGDNHQGFITTIGKTKVINCGSLMRRRSDQINYKPMMGLITEDGDIIPHYLDTSKDKYIESNVIELEKVEANMTDFFNGLKSLGKTGLDFEEAVKEYIIKNAVSKDVENWINRAIK